MAAEIQIKITGAAELERKLRDVVLDMATMTEAVKGAIDVIEKRSDDIFKAEGSNIAKGPAWKGLAPSTLTARANRWGYYKQAASGGGGILQWTGKLKKSRVKKVEKDYGLFGFTADYAGYHQEGHGTRPPQRKIIDLDNKTNELIVKEFQKRVQKILQKRTLI